MMVENKNLFKGNTTLGHRERMRKKVLEAKKELTFLQDYEILEMLLFYTNPRMDVKPIAKSLLEKFGNLDNILMSKTFEDVKGAGDNFVCLIKLINELYTRVHKDKLDEPDCLIEHFSDLLAYLRLKMEGLEVEGFRILLFDNGGRMIEDVLLSEGTVDKASVFPREILRHVIKTNAKSIVMCHNHPSGSVNPSPADVNITRLVISHLASFEVIVQDHVIIGKKKKYFSFREKGLL